MGSASVISHTYGSATTSAPCSSWAAKVVDSSELLQHYDMVVVVMEKILSRASPKHRAREEDKLARGGEDANQRAYERRGLECVVRGRRGSFYRRRGGSQGVGCALWWCPHLLPT